MLKQFFSFEGRIRRLEYALSLIVYTIAFVALNVMSLSGMKYYRHTEYIMFVHLPLLWFLMAQRGKRCHDLGQPAWWQFIPFYDLWLVFQDGQHHQNTYGSDPKHRN